MDYPFRNLIFEGGGVKGIAYVGALRGLEERKILRKIQRVGGTSAGAINAVLLGLGYALDETSDILSELDFNKFLDDAWGIVRDSKRLVDRFGWYKGDYFRSWIGDRIREKTGNENSTFNDLKNRKFLDVYLVGTNLSTGFTEVFSAEHTPRERVADAVRISMSIPLFFTAIRNTRKDVYVDGGVLRNYPVKLFDREKYIKKTDRDQDARKTDYYKETNEKIAPTSSPYVYNMQTLGFRLDSAAEIGMFRDGAEPQHTKIDDFFDYGWALIKTFMNAQNNQHLHNDDWNRTVYIDTIGVGTTDFDLADDKKQALVEEGLEGIRQYFDWYDDQNSSPINRRDSEG